MSKYSKAKKEKVTPISEERVKRQCKSRSHTVPGIFVHTKEVQSDGWTRYVCLTCGQVKFIRARNWRRRLNL